MSSSPLVRVLFWTCLTLVLLRMGIPGLGNVIGTPGQDFASYHYGLEVALSGRNPYDLSLLRSLAQQDGLRTAVFPFFYPPPFLLFCLPFAPLSLPHAFVAWYLVDCLVLAGVLRVLWRMLGPLSGEAVRPALPVVLAVLAATFTPIFDNLTIGQVNLPVLLLLLLGVERVLEGKDLAGGALVAVAAMMKMSPALLIVWFLLERRWKAVLGAALGALLLSLVALPLVGLSEQVYFYTTVLPGFAGEYHGHKVSIGLIGNASIPALFNFAFPGPERTSLSLAARLLSYASEALILGAVCWLFRGRRDRDQDGLGPLLELGLLVVLMVWFPVYTFEHHLVFLLFPLTVLAVALVQGRLSSRWWPWVGVAYALLAFLLSDFKPVYSWERKLGPLGEVLSFLAREIKFACMAFLVVALGAARRGRAAAREATVKVQA